MTPIFGVRAVLAAVQAKRRAVLRVWIARGRVEDVRTRELIAAVQEAGIPLASAPRPALDERAGSRSHQGVVALAAPLSHLTLESIVGDGAAPDGLMLFLDGVQDPHNLGAVVRSAAAAGAQAVVVPRDRAVKLTAAAVKVAAGAAEHVPVVRVTNVRRALDRVRAAGYWAVGFEPQVGRPWCDVELARPVVLVLGGEDRGVRRLVREGCDELAHIPITVSSGSLNVSATAAVVLFEVRRQRLATGT